MKKNKFSPIDLLFFNRLIMPSVLTFIYWIALILIVGGGLITMFAGSFIYGLVTLVLGLIGTRLWFELICVGFSINRNLEKLVSLQSGNEVKPTKPEDFNNFGD